MSRKTEQIAKPVTLADLDRDDKLATPNLRLVSPQ